MNNNDNTINYSTTISSIDRVFESLSYIADLKSAYLPDQAIQKLPRNKKESWSLFKFKKHWVGPILLDFNDWLKKKIEAHVLVKQSTSKAKPEDNSLSVTKTRTASKVFASNSPQRDTKKQIPSTSTNTCSHCLVCNHQILTFKLYCYKTNISDLNPFWWICNHHPAYNRKIWSQLLAMSYLFILLGFSANIFLRSTHSVELEWSAGICTCPSDTDNASLIKELADAIASKKNDPMAKWQLAQYNGESLQWHEWYGQFESAIDSQSLNVDVKLTYLETLVKDKLRALEHNLVSQRQL